jgi:preprotein translocase subunit SecG
MKEIGKKISGDVKTAFKPVGKVMQGHAVVNFLSRNWLVAILIVIMIVLHIASRYSYNDKMTRITQLRQENNDLQIRQNILSSELMQITLEENIINRIKEKGMGLSPADTGLIIINKIQK